MKKNTVKGVFLFGMLVFAVTLNAQSKPKNKYTLLTAREQDSLSAAYAKASKEQKQQAEELAKIKGWPLTKNGEDGSFSELMKLDDFGQPIYYTTSNAGAAITARANRVYPNGGAGLALTGAGITAGIWDGGQVLASHTTFSTGRVQVMDSDMPVALHPTHVAGTIIGNGGAVATARGIAYQGNLLGFNWNSDIAEMTSVADQIVASNHSYGLDADGSTPAYLFGKYDDKARNADNVAFNFPYYQICVAAGNDRGSAVNSTKYGYDLLSQMGVAKNALTVAAINEVRNYAAISPSDVRVASFSNYGPTDDFRIKPNIATKGVNVYSSGNANNFSFVTQSGTSMATPGITGVIMLLQQHFSNLHPVANEGDLPNYMTSASVRGLLQHTADEIGTEEGPDAMTGWGLVNTEAAAAVLTAKNADEGKVVFEERTLNQGETYTVRVLASSAAKISASISWTDPAGNTANNTTDSSAAALVNNLDIKVTDAANTVFLPWKLNTSFSNSYITVGENNVDNFEKVDVAEASGWYTVTVSHKGTLRNNQQAYTLIVTGIDRTGGLEDVAENSLMVWPNPSNGFVNVQLSGTAFASDAYMSVYDIQGRQVLARKASGTLEKINTDNFSSGVYFLKLTNGGKRQVQKFIVK